MIKYSTIGVGTDGSDSSLAAVRAAASQARVYDATLVILSAWYSNTGSLLNSPASDVSSVPVVSEDRADEYLAEAQTVAEKEGAPRIELRKMWGTPAAALLKETQDRDIDLLVIGNQGVNTLTGRLFGNIPTEILRGSSVNVLVVNTQDPAS